MRHCWTEHDKKLAGDATEAAGEGFSSAPADNASAAGVNTAHIGNGVPITRQHSGSPWWAEARATAGGRDSFGLSSDRRSNRETSMSYY